MAAGLRPHQRQVGRNVTDIDKIADQTAAEIGLAYRAGKADPVAVTECFLDRIERHWSGNAFISLCRDRALAEAREAAARYRDGRPLSPLDGVPIAWKDNIDVASTRTTAGSDLLRDSGIKRQDAPCVANAAAAGMVSLGKLNMTEFAYSGRGLNPHFGTPANPNDPKVERAPGGSSSGAGVAVAARLAPCAIGSDTGGSVRVPAAFNGIVGFKTSEGRIDKTGVVALSRTLDTVGPLARSVGDCVLLDAALRGKPASDVRRTGLEGLTMVAPDEIVLDEAEPAVLANFERSLDALREVGVAIVRRNPAALAGVAALAARYGTLTAAESFHDFRKLVESDDVKRMDRRVVSRIMGGRNMTADAVLALQSGRRELAAQLTQDLDGALLVMPTTAIVAPEVAPLDADDALFYRINLLTLRNTMFGNVLNLCGLALPNGSDSNGMPTSILFSATGGEDERLLGYGLEIERMLTEAGA